MAPLSFEKNLVENQAVKRPVAQQEKRQGYGELLQKIFIHVILHTQRFYTCLLYTSPSPRD